MKLETHLKSLSALLVGAGLTTGVAGAQSKGPELPPIRQLGAVTATATEKLGIVTALRPLPDGRLYVNDASGRRVLLFDASLQGFTIVADSMGANGNTYSGRAAGLIAYRGDSTLFVDPQSLSMLVLDPVGKVARVMSVPNAQDAMSFAGILGSAGMDPEGRLVYRGSPRFDFRAMGPMTAGGDLPHRSRHAKDGHARVHQDAEDQDERDAGREWPPDHDLGDQSAPGRG